MPDPINHVTESQLQQLSQQLQHMFTHSNTSSTTQSDTISSTPNTIHYMYNIQQIAYNTLQQSIKLLKVGTLFYTYIQNHNKLIKKTLLLKYSSIYKHGCIQLYTVNTHNTAHITECIHTIELHSIQNIYIGKSVCNQLYSNNKLFSNNSIDALCFGIEYTITVSAGDTRPSAVHTCILALEALNSNEMLLWIITLLALMQQSGKHLDIVPSTTDATLLNSSTVVNTLQSTLQPPVVLKQHNTTESQQKFHEWVQHKKHELLQQKQQQEAKQAELERTKHTEKLQRRQVADTEYAKWLQTAEQKLQQQMTRKLQQKQQEQLKQQQHSLERKQQLDTALQKLEQRLHTQQRKKLLQTQKLQQSKSVSQLEKTQKHNAALKQWYNNKSDQFEFLRAKQYAQKLLDGIEYENQQRAQQQAAHDKYVANMSLSVTGTHVPHTYTEPTVSDDLNTTIDTILSDSHISPSVLLDVTKMLQYERQQQKQLESNWQNVYIPPVITSKKTKKMKHVTVRPVWNYNRPKTAQPLKYNVVEQTV